MLTEKEFEGTPDVEAAKAHLQKGLEGITPGELEAFWEAVRRCYASALDDEETPLGST